MRSGEPEDARTRPARAGIRGETCALCGRGVLPGEPLHHFEDPARGRRRWTVCTQCERGAFARGWVRPRARAATDHRAPAA